MLVRRIGLAVMVVALGVALAACGCFQQAMRGEQAPPPAPEQKAAAAPEERHEAAPAPEAQAAPAPEAAIELSDIYFDFDKYDIRPGDAEVLKKNYEWFSSQTGRVRIEGNCDERGTVEYNLVLGQKRADAAKHYLVGLGVAQGRLETISYGKEKPLDPGHDEAAWAKNRRDHFTPLEK